MGISSSLSHSQILDLLIDGPSSFAALYSAMRKQAENDVRPTIDETLDYLFEMEKLDWIRGRLMSSSREFLPLNTDDRQKVRSAYKAYFSSACSPDTTVDEIGLWYEIVDAGRREWNACFESESPQSPGLWILDEVSDSRTLVIHADRKDIGEKALASWLSSHPDFAAIEESMTVVPCAKFQLRNGTIINDGIKLVVSYRRRAA